MVKQNFSHNPARICTTSACVKESAIILRNLDQSVDPCENFAQFSCGRFRETHPFKNKTKVTIINNEEAEFQRELNAFLESDLADSDRPFERQIKLAYRACMNVNFSREIEVLQQLVHKFGKWPVLHPTMMRNKEMLVDEAGKPKLFKQLNNPELFNIFFKLISFENKNTVSYEF